MRLKKLKTTAKEELLSLINECNDILLWIRDEHQKKTKDEKIFRTVEIELSYQARVNTWLEKVLPSLNSIFPATTEAQTFMLTTVPTSESIPSQLKLQHSYQYLRLEEYKKTLENILVTNLPMYIDLTAQYQISVDDIDSFSMVKSIQPASVVRYLKNGRLEMPEEDIQQAFEDILDEFYHQKDSGVEINDLYTSNVKLNNIRISTAFLLKGPAVKSKILHIKDCGKNGDQLVRLCESPAELFIVQFIGEVSQYVIKDILGKVNEKRLRGEQAWFCIINGQDTARVLFAYNKL